jgi:hypothetical protein
MVTYKYGSYLTKNESDLFDKLHSLEPHSGIYRCVNCQRALETDPLTSIEN